MLGIRFTVFIKALFFQIIIIFLQINIVLASPNSEFSHNFTKNVRFVVLWSSPQRSLFDIWISSLADSVSSDGIESKSQESFYYSIVSEFLPHVGGLGDGRFGDLQWRGAVQRKVAMLAETMVTTLDEDFVVFSDVDLIFFNNSLSRILGYHKWSGNDVTFMAEPRAGANTGFMVLTASEVTRRFAQTWSRHVVRNDQLTLNEWLLRSPTHTRHFGFRSSAKLDQNNVKEGNCSTGLDALNCPPIGDLPPRMGVFPARLACNRQENLYYDSALYHVIGFRHGGVAMKVTQLGKVAQRMADWQTERRRQ
mmetsp:Transcript_60451/g.113844  ORF Transcript_60451/g.113844 Transcript_60451/m.113844 type:complete len:308 (+) Transcript_60451:65-988(+)